MNCTFNTTPENALSALSHHGGPVLVDLDETLFLRNSTEEFISCAIPGLLALLMIRALDAVRPWRWTGGDVSRDVWRVSCILFFFPWTLLVWRHHVASLSKQYINKPLANALTLTKQRYIIVTVGFTLIVAPLIKAFNLNAAQIVSCRLSFKDRRKGKLAMAIESIGIENVQQSLLITDSLDDLPILQVCAKPLRVIWPDATYRQALTHVYLPGQYISKIKRPGERYIFRGIIQEDFAFWLMSSLALAQRPLLYTIGLALLSLSFRAIYERGYVDNDFIAARYEKSPKLGVNYWSSTVATPVWQPWIWALGSGAIAILLMRGSDLVSAKDFIKWFALLAGTYAWFKLYNRYDKLTRIWMFGVLQFVRSAAFLVLVPCEVIGLAAIAAHALARWVPYFMYRFGSKSWPNDTTQTVRLLFFILLATLFSMAFGISSILNATGILLLLWNIFRARHELSAIIKDAHRIDIVTQESPQECIEENIVP